MKVDHAIESVTDAEQGLAKALERLAGRHAAEHDLYHLGHAQAEKATARIRRLDQFAKGYGSHSTADVADPEPGLMDTLRQQASDLMGRSTAPGLMLLADLQETYLAAQRAEIAWIILQQAARARRDTNLVSTVTSCHEECETTAKWLRTRIKVAAPQILATG
jgi:hypothetical protein